MIVVLGSVYTRRDTSTNWASVNPVLGAGEIGLDITLKNFKVGDGATAWNDLAYWVYNPGTNDVQIEFTSVDSVNINWQTDEPVSGAGTYASLMGNKFPKPVVYINSGGSTYINPGAVPTVEFDGTLINTVSFDFGAGTSNTGYIRF